MIDDNNRNLQYFDADSMAGLFDAMQAWQTEHQKRLLSVAIQSDGGRFCCIALTNPMEVIICHGGSLGQARVFSTGRLSVSLG